MIAILASLPADRYGLLSRSHKRVVKGRARASGLIAGFMPLPARSWSTLDVSVWISWTPLGSDAPPPSGTIDRLIVHRRPKSFLPHRLAVLSVLSIIGQPGESRLGDPTWCSGG